jgi:hypothetical protein
MKNSLSNKAISNAFSNIIEKVDRNKFLGVLFNWNNVEINEDGDKLITYPGRNGRYSRGAEGGKSYVTKKSFFEWLFSDAPFDTKVYGKNILTDSEWASDIKEIREASGMMEKGAD